MSTVSDLFHDQRLRHVVYMIEREIQAAIVRADMWLERYGLVIVAVIAVLAVAAIIIGITTRRSERYGGKNRISPTRRKREVSWR